MQTIQAKKTYTLDDRQISDGEHVKHRRSECHGVAWWWECRCGSTERILRLARPADATHAYDDLNDMLRQPVSLTTDGPWWECAECHAWYNAR